MLVRIEAAIPGPLDRGSREAGGTAVLPSGGGS